MFREHDSPNTKRVIRARERFFKRVRQQCHGVFWPRKSAEEPRCCDCICTLVAPVRFTHTQPPPPARGTGPVSASAVATFSSPANLARALCCWASGGGGSGEINEMMMRFEAFPQGPP